MRILIFAIILVALTACGTSPSQMRPDAPATDVREAAVPNPASIHCIQTGNKLEIRIAEDGSQKGICVFPDQSTCDEWAYYRGECGFAAQASPVPTVTAEPPQAVDGLPGGTNPGSYMPPETAEEINGWWGVIKSTDRGAQYDDYFERQDLGQAIYFGIDSMDPAVQAQIKALRDSGKIVHLYGILLSNVPDYNGSQIQVERIELQE